jgi:hypothetical protein
MGAKAKRAIAGAERAIASMTQVAADLKSHFAQMYKQKGRHLDLQIELAKYVKNTYPGDSDLKARAAEDPEIARLVKEIAEAKAKGNGFFQNCLDDLDSFEAEADKIVDAANEVTKLINTKRAKRNEPTKNIVKKLVNKAKTKSLGDLVEEKAKILAAINEIGPIVDQVKRDINFRKQ